MFKQLTTLHLSWIQPPPSNELRNGIKMAVSQSYKRLETLWRPKKIYGSVDVLVALRKLEAAFKEDDDEEGPQQQQGEVGNVAGAASSRGSRQRTHDEF